MRTHYTYKGHIIWRNTSAGYRLRWYSIGIGAADTLTGMRELIREHS